MPKPEQQLRAPLNVRREGGSETNEEERVEDEGGHTVINNASPAHARPSYR